MGILISMNARTGLTGESWGSVFIIDAWSVFFGVAEDLEAAGPTD